jgi:hypothetical protein
MSNILDNAVAALLDSRQLVGRLTVITVQFCADSTVEQRIGPVEQQEYVARCRRVDGWWAVDVYDRAGVRIKGAHTQARRLDQVEGAVREVVSLLLDLPEDSIQVQLDPDLPPDLRQEVERAKALRGQAEDVQHEAAEAIARAAMDLVRRERLTVRDAGRILDLSHQRVDQLVRKRAS